jgi:hypothetical protein
MSFSVNYQKRKNIHLFNKLQTNKNIQLTHTQNYIPIYERFFLLNNTNWNSINLNHKWYISDIKEPKKDEEENVYTCKLKNILDDSDELTSVQKVFIKMAPLLDPYKYLVGKYNHNDPQLFQLPSLDKTLKIHPKVADANNSSYIDGFFSFLTSQLLNEHSFIHGVDYYGSFLAIKNNYKLNIIDDIDYLVQSDFFNKNQNTLFKVDDYSHLITVDEKKPLQPLKITTSLKSVLSVKSIDNSIFEDIFEQDKDQDSNSISLQDVKTMGVELVDITHSNVFDVTNQKKSETLKSGSSCSSRTSHTNENDLSEVESNGEESVKEENITMEENTLNIGSDEELNDDDTNWEDINDSDDESSVEEESLFLTFPQFPVQVICMEHCENTLDDLILNNELTNEDEWFAVLMQIIMILITYQKTFALTHNDLHTNNIMYVSTNKKFLYYVYKKKTYKVPTFGKIYKMIDYGRSIYKFNGKLFCSDSFQTGGDAATQYNTEPYFNDTKPRIEPNYSFDLCRLACSIFDYIVDDFDTIKNLNDCSPIVKLIVEWCIDDNGVNVLYKNNGVERYPDFKLYKMISRYVHKHTPVAQLERTEFSQFQIPNKNVPKQEIVINIDDLPCYTG